MEPVGQELNLFMKKEGVGFLNTMEEEDDLPVWICLCEVFHDNSNSSTSVLYGAFILCRLNEQMQRNF